MESTISIAQATAAADGLTRDNGEPAPQICETDLRDVQAVDEDAAFRGLNETEEREREGALAGACAAEDAHLFTRANLKVEIVEHVGEIGLHRMYAYSVRDAAFEKSAGEERTA